MKKVILICVLISMILLVGCAEKATEPDKIESKKTSTAQPDKQLEKEEKVEPTEPACFNHDDCRNQDPDAECALAGTKWAICVLPEMITIEDDECSYDEDCDDNNPDTSDVCEIVSDYTMCFNNGDSNLVEIEEEIEEEVMYEEVIEEEYNPSPQDLRACDDLDCFIEASEDCTPATVEWKNGFSMFGMWTESMTLMELRGTEDGACRYYQKTMSMAVSFDEETRQAMLDDGKTEEEISETEDTANTNAQAGVGMERNCLWDATDLTTTLQNWKAGKVSSRDYDAAECE